MRYKDLIPKIFVCFKEGYTGKVFTQDLFAGVGIAMIAIPLSLSYAIASGLTPERGLYAAIIGGFLVSLLGGSRVQIGGPAGAFVVLVYSIVQRHGYEGLLVATVIAAFLLVLMGIFRFGVLLKFIPYPVTTGFTTGIGALILTSQVKDFFGLEIATLPPKFTEKCSLFCQMAHTWNLSAVALSTCTLALIFLLRRLLPRFPGAIFAVIIATLVSVYLQLPIETIGSKFGSIPRMLPSPSLPHITPELIKQVFPDAVTVAMLCAIESLLCAVIADGMTGQRHRSNCELIAQGFANLGAVFFGGMPVTGTIARTSANIRLGAKTPIAGIIHAVSILLIMLLFAPLASQIPLAALAGLLVFVAWNMLELPHFISILKTLKGDALVLVTTFLLTLFIDLTVAVQVGVVLAAVIFLKRMTDKTTVEICQLLVRENEKETPEGYKAERAPPLPAGVALFEIKGPFFYSVADLLEEALGRLSPAPHTFLLRVDNMPLIDATGLRAFKQFAHKCKDKNIAFVIAGTRPELEMLFKKSGVEKAVGKDRIFAHLDKAIESL